MAFETFDHSVSVPGGEIFAREWTPASPVDGAPLILLHDSLGCVAVWRDFPALLCAATRRRVIAYDRLGFGRSSARRDRLPMNFISQEAEVFLPCILDHLQIDAFVPFGHSVGGGMAIHCGTALRDACRAIIAESAQAFVEDRTLEGIAEGGREYAAAERFERLEKYHGARAGWILHAWTGTWLAPDFASWSVREELPLITCPILAMHGDQDEFGSTAHPQLIGALSGGSVEVRILRDCGHVPHRERPESIIEAIDGFLGGIGSPSRTDEASLKR